MAHPSHANIVDEAAEGLLNRRESSLSGDSDSFAQPSARVLGEPLSDRSSEMDEVKPRRLIDSQGRIVSIDQDQQKEEDSLMDFEEQERKIAQQIERDKQTETASMEPGKATPWKMEEVNDVVVDEEEDGEQLVDEMSRIEEENEDEEEEEVIKDEEEEGEEEKERKDDEKEEAAEEDELGNGEDDDELLGFGQSLMSREAPDEPISSSHSRVSESLQNRQFSGAEVLKRDEGLLQKSANSTQSSIEGFPVGYPTDPPPAYTSPRNSGRPGTAKMLGPTHGKDPSGETMTTGHGFPVPSPRYASRIRHLSGGTEHAEDAEDEESEQFGGAGSSSNIRQAIGHSFAFAGGMAAAVAAGTPGSPSSSSPRATGVDASPRGGGRRLESARVVHGARTAAELRASVGSAAGRRTSAKGERSQSTAAGQGGQQQDDQSNRYPISSELKTLFRHIEEFVADRVDIEPSLRPFQIDYIPAVGDVDPFVKIPRPDDNDELLLGLAVLDEPATQQSDSAIVDLRLHQMSGKSSTAPDAPVKKLSRADRNVHQIDRWIQNVKELRRTKAPARVTYGKPMPSIEALMQEWPPEMEQQLRSMKLMLNSTLDAELEDYADLCLGLVDIPLHKSRLESLHVLFSLYAEFRASQHFRNLALDRTETERGDTAPSTTIDQFILEEGRH